MSNRFKRKYERNVPETTDFNAIGGLVSQLQHQLWKNVFLVAPLSICISIRAGLWLSSALSPGSQIGLNQEGPLCLGLLRLEGIWVAASGGGSGKEEG